MAGFPAIGWFKTPLAHIRCVSRSQCLGGKTAFNFGLNLHRCRQIAQSTITINTATTGGGGLGTDPIPNPAIASLDFGPTGKMRNDAEDGHLQDSAHEKDNGASKDYLRWRKAKKVALMISFSGKDYLGMQRNPNHKTIEEELMLAFKKNNVIAPEWYDVAQKAFFQRASRTDKGVSAVKMVVSLKMVFNEKNPEETLAQIQKDLPPTIQINELKRVTNNFNCKSACDSRSYEYLLPTFTFHSVADLPVPDQGLPPTTTATQAGTDSGNGVCSHPMVPNDGDDGEEEPKELVMTPELEEAFKLHESFRMDEALRAKVNDILQKFVGSRYFHNYTSGKLPLEPSSQRYITQFECGQPFEAEGLEFVVVRVKGQSFMLHQIRKMVGMAVAVARGVAAPEAVDATWNVDRIDVPRAPGLGLMLEEVHYDSYNRKFGKDGIHEPLDWTLSAEKVARFKRDLIFGDIIATEKKDRSMLVWLRCLARHKFEARHFEERHDSSAGNPMRTDQDQGLQVEGAGRAAAKDARDDDQGACPESKRRRTEAGSVAGEQDPLP